MSRPLPTLAHGEFMLEQTLRIAPSNISTWRGIRAADQLFTHNQLYRLRERGMDAETCEFLIVRQPVSMREMWWPATDRTPVWIMPCPVLKRGMGGRRVFVLTPMGGEEWVNADGTIAPRPPAATRGRGYPGRKP